ncbi:MAG: multicopper oxidase domain-containing protein [Alphaproteobacteria bacterium]|nr:multicopper oxidase domain-containing protein [Alphaproteobacteria bacterium]
MRDPTLLSSPFSRRRFLSLLPGGFAGAALAAVEEEPRLVAQRREIEVLGRPAEAFRLALRNGQEGLHLEPGDRLRFVLHNEQGVALRPHLHGQTPPAGTEAAVQAGGDLGVDLAPRPGSHWIHSTGDLTRQRLLAAPLIVHGPRPPWPELTVLLQDFCFRPAEEILANWQDPAWRQNFQPDTCLANGHGLDAPDPVRVAPGQRLLLRLINAAATSDFILDAGPLRAQLMAVDGNPVRPLPVRKLPLLLGQRADLLLEIPPEHGAWSLLARRARSRLQTGIIFGTRRGQIRRLSLLGEGAAEGGDPAIDMRLAPPQPDPHLRQERRLALRLADGAPGAPWRLISEDGQPLALRPGDEVELTLRNATATGHVLHLHGHHVRVIGLNGQLLPGILRDTFAVPARGSAVIAFRADRAGDWPIVGQNLYDGLSGLSATLSCRE